MATPYLCELTGFFNAMTEAWVQLSDQQYPYHFVRSKRAKYLRLKLAHNGDLSVVVPEGISLKKASLFVDSQADWLERKLPQLKYPNQEKYTKPELLDLKCLGESWSLSYLSDDTGSSITITPDVSATHLLCSGLVDDKELLNRTLGLWLKSKAEITIPSRLSSLAEDHGFHYRRVTIRGQKTRWGSCSSQKNINLNYKLLFLPPAMVDYVLIHELCHTLEMNHSKRFWALVADCDPDYKRHDKALNEYARAIPI